MLSVEQYCLFSTDNIEPTHSTKKIGISEIHLYQFFAVYFTD